jgi:hypothetical protein
MGQGGGRGSVRHLEGIAQPTAWRQMVSQAHPLPGQYGVGAWFE